MSRAAIKEDAATVIGPQSGSVIALAVSTASSRFIIHSTMVGRWCSFEMDGADADVVFGGSTVACTYAKVSTVSTEAITPLATTGWHLEDGQTEDWLVEKAHIATHFAVVATAAGVLYIRPSGP